MLRRPLLATTTVSATALALSLVAPAAALAAPGDSGQGRPAETGSAPQSPPGQEGRGAEAEQASAPGRSAEAPAGQARGHDKAAANARPSRGADQGGKGAAAGGAQADGKTQGKSQGKAQDQGQRGGGAAAPGKAAPRKDRPAAPAQGSGQGAEQNTNEAGDPPGNNGTIKISSLPVGEGRGNVPHPGCDFALVHYGFDAGQTADITFTAHAPTGSGETLLQQTAVPISSTPAGGGQDRDAVLTYSAADLGLTGAAPHEKGWHVKVAVDALEAPGGAKQKVFWLDCPVAAQGSTQDGAAGGNTTEESGGGSTEGSTSSEADAQDATAGESTGVLDSVLTRELAGSLVGPAGAAAPSGPSFGVLSALANRPAGTAGAGAGSSVRPSALPFTGSPLLPAVLAMSAAALAAGAGLLRAGSRRQTV